VMAEPGFYERDQATVQKALDRLQTLQAELDSLFSEWEALEERGMRATPES